MLNEEPTHSNDGVISHWKTSKLDLNEFLQKNPSVIFDPTLKVGTNVKNARPTEGPEHRNTYNGQLNASGKAHGFGRATDTRDPTCFTEGFFVNGSNTNCRNFYAA